MPREEEDGEGQGAGVSGADSQSTGTFTEWSAVEGYTDQRRNAECEAGEWIRGLDEQEGERGSRRVSVRERAWVGVGVGRV